MSGIKIKYDPALMEHAYKSTFFVDGLQVHVSPDDWELMVRYRWHIKYSHSVPYVVRKSSFNGRPVTVRLHREIMKTPNGMDCHHRNRNSLDNRRENLLNVTPEHHRQLKFAMP